MASQVEILVCGGGTLMLEGGRAGPYTPTLVSSKYWHRHKGRLTPRVRTVDDYAGIVRRMKENQCMAECKRRDLDKSGGVHEMRARLLDGIAPYEPAEHVTEEEDAEEVLTLAERAQNAEDRDTLKSLIEEAGVSDEVDLRYGTEKLKAALLDALDPKEDTDDEEEEQAEDGDSEVDVSRQDD